LTSCSSNGICGGLEIIVGIAEKPSISKRIAKILAQNGKVTVKKSASKYNRIYEFSLDGEKIAITSVLGHIYQNDFPVPYNKWSQVKPRALLGAPIQKKPKMKAVEQTVKDVVRGADTLIIMTDADREGENIGMQIVRIATEVSPNIIIKRMRFSAVTPPQIWEAYQNLGGIDFALGKASEARQEIDLRMGAAFTRMATLSIRHWVPSREILSIGPVQTPTLGLIVKQWETTQQFQPTPFWYLAAFIRIGDAIFEARWELGRVFDKAEVLRVYNKIHGTKKAIIAQMDQKLIKKYPPPPLNTVALTSIAAKALSVPSETTMNVAEALYNTGFISYPRTETEIYPKSLNLKNLVEKQAKTKTTWANYAEALLLSKSGLNPTSGKRRDNAHPPIHPVKAATNKAVLTRVSELKKYPRAWDIYELVTRHFLATLSSPARIHVGKAILEIATVRFILRGRALVTPGYLEVYPYEQIREKYLPRLNEGSILDVSDIVLREDTTRPPLPFTETGLIKKMDRLGLGTDATIPQHIQTNVKRGYFTISSDRVIQPTARGIALIQSLEKSVNILVNPEIRAWMEQQVMAIQLGEKTYEHVLKELRSSVLEMFDQFATNIGSFTFKMVQELRNSQRDPELQSRQSQNYPKQKTTSRTQRRQKTKVHTTQPRGVKREGKNSLTSSSAMSLTNLTQQKVGICPVCKADTYYFERETKRWLRCSNRPTCSWGFPLPTISKGNILLEKQSCPSCNDPLLLYHRSDGKYFRICAHCAVYCWKCPDAQTCPVESSPASINQTEDTQQTKKVKSTKKPRRSRVARKT